MEYTYEIITDEFGNTMLLRSDGAWVPMVAGNSDYQVYLAAQSTPILNG